jgi:2'-5' RNA ligase
MDEGRSTGCSLWLMPEGELRDRLGGWIDRLAARSGTERFLPHLTLLAGLAGRDEELLDAARAAAGAVGCLRVRLNRVAGRDEHFRCLFLQAVHDEALAAAHAAAARAFGRPPLASFLPHLSLVYGRLAPVQKQTLAVEAGTLLPTEIEVRRLHLWRTDGRASDWRELAAFDLVGPRVQTSV